MVCQPQTTELIGVEEVRERVGIGVDKALIAHSLHLAAERVAEIGHFLARERRVVEPAAVAAAGLRELLIEHQREVDLIVLDERDKELRLFARLVKRRRLGIDVRADEDAVVLRLGEVFPEAGVRQQPALGAPAAQRHADDGKVHAGGGDGLPVDPALELGYVDAAHQRLARIQGTGLKVLEARSAVCERGQAQPGRKHERKQGGENSFHSSGAPFGRNQAAASSGISVQIGVVSAIGSAGVSGFGFSGSGSTGGSSPETGFSVR